jgi:scyllo-inositol 2-dehydrogenase (NADP+)
VSIGCAVVGYGGQFSMGQHHADQIERTDGLELAAIYDVDPARREAARAEQTVTVHDTYEEVLADKSVDLVILVTPHDTHAPLSIAASNAGKHVFTEKVMCLNVEQAREMIAAAKEAGKMLSVYQNRRWDGDYLTVRKVLAGGALGEVFQIDSSVNGWWHPANWRAQRKAGGGMLYDWGAHLFDQLVQINLPAKPVKVFATGFSGVWDDMDVEAQNTVTVLFDNGVSAQVDVGCVSRIPRSRWLVRGTKGSLHLPDFKRAQLRTEVGGIVGTMDIEVEADEWNAVYRNISDHINKGAELIVKPEEVLTGVAAIEAAHRSVKSGQAEEVRF